MLKLLVELAVAPALVELLLALVVVGARGVVVADERGELVVLRFEGDPGLLELGLLPAHPAIRHAALSTAVAAAAVMRGRLTLPSEFACA